jgi:KDO2-lipid IV(A) lauroyltransferase
MLVELRKGVGVTTIGKGFDLRGAIGCLRHGEILGVLLDQDAKEKGVVAPFLGLPASTPYGPVKLAQRMGSPIVPLFIVRRDSVCRHDLYVLPPLEVTADVKASVTRCNDVISEWIARFPEGWLWLYPRWASTVKGD